MKLPEAAIAVVLVNKQALENSTPAKYLLIIILIK